LVQRVALAAERLRIRWGVGEEEKGGKEGTEMEEERRRK
jgi:hypothetical protein